MVYGDVHKSSEVPAVVCSSKYRRPASTLLKMFILKYLKKKQLSPDTH